MNPVEEAKKLRSELNELTSQCLPTPEKEQNLRKTRSAKKRNAIWEKINARKTQKLERVHHIRQRLDELMCLPQSERPLAVHEYSVHAERFFEQMEIVAIGQLLSYDRQALVKAVQEFCDTPDASKMLAKEILGIISTAS